MPAAPQPPAPQPPAPVRPSTFDALKHAASNPATVMGVLVMAITALTTALKTSADNEAQARLAYEALRAASERHGVQIEACRQSQLEQTVWIEELSNRLERRQATTEKVIKTKVTRAAAAPVAPVVVEPAPKPPAAPAPLAPSALPPFDGLALRGAHDT
jgi:hypothetical protein